MKKLLLLFAMLLSFSIASAQTDKTETKTENMEKAKKAATRSSKTEKRRNDKTDAKMAPQSTTAKDQVRSGSGEPLMDDTPAAPGTNASPTVPLDAPSNKSNQSPENNGQAPTAK